MAKHTIESGDTPSAHKRPKLTPTVLLLDTIVKQADVVLKMIPVIQTNVSRPEDKETVQSWRYTCEFAKQKDAIWTEKITTLLDDRLPDDNRLFQSYNETYESFSSIQKLKLLSLPGPSEFALKWSRYEKRFKDRFLCFRPPSSRGLPLCTLHDVFRQYCITAQEPIPVTSTTAISAMQSASELCLSMGQSFSSKDEDSSAMQHTRDDKENARAIVFDQCMGDILGSFKKFMTLRPKAELHSGIVDGALMVMDIPFGLREMKGEPGTGGDPYMQIVRSYDLSVKVLQEKENLTAQGFLKEGAPMFLLCVSGPELLVAGGFWDGKTVTVEPLGDPCLMFNDKGRIEKLARVLYALAIGITQLKDRLDRTSPDVYPASTPRIYRSCRLSDEQSVSGQLTFMTKINSTNSNRFIFTASLSKSPSESIPVLVKLVYDRYGEDVHRLLAEHGLAPQFYGVSEAEGAPKAYVMEHLDPSSWKPLSDFSSLPNAFVAPIQLSIEKVLVILHDGGKVHGDLRPPNIMVNVSSAGNIILIEDRASIKIVDFDWAGDAGTVLYPLLRNPDIEGLTWPGKPGGSIKKKHDRKLFASWWNRFGRDS